jgi:hypothetical protein
MNHTELLDQLIDAVYALPFTTFKEAHDLQMLAAEIKGRMQASEPTTPSDDGWIENTGVMPECDISAIRLHDGEVIKVANDKHWAWAMKSPNPEEFSITHYKPA